MKVQVYYNLHKKLLSVRHKGKVIKHAGMLCLTDAKFHVQPAGQAKVRREKRKNVHAYISGDLGPKQIMSEFSNDKSDLAVKVKYNPYKYDFFVDENGNEMRDKYDCAFVIGKDIYVRKDA
jgi:uncharacterized protein YycO